MTLLDEKLIFKRIKNKSFKCRIVSSTITRKILRVIFDHELNMNLKKNQTKVSVTLASINRNMTCKN